MKHTRPPFSRRSFLSGAAAASATLRYSSAWAERMTQDTPSPYTLHFGQPASKWPDALPVGNGRLGAVVFGSTDVERIQLNEESIWDGEPNRDRSNPKAGEAVPRIRELLFGGRVAEAEALAVSDLLSIPRRMPCYQTMGDLFLDFSPMGLSKNTPVENYRLALDLDTAIVSTTFTYGGVTYRREVFSSAPDQVIVLHLIASAPGKISFSAQLTRPQGGQSARVAKDRLSMSAQALPVHDNPGLQEKEHQTGVRFYAELLAAPAGSTRAAAGVSEGAQLDIRDADSVTLFLDCATSYRYPARTGKHSGVDADVLMGDQDAMRAAVRANLLKASAQPFGRLRARHIADHQRLFRRASFDLGPDPKANLATDARVKAVKGGGEDTHLLPIYFQYGRYMLISSSRPGTLAANLQGIWNESVDPPWGSKYTVNINAQMNYWFAESANLSECHLPLFDLLRATVEPGRTTASKLYKARGSVVHHNTDLWGDGGPIDGLGGGVWPMGACWLSLHLWTHYAFTGDRHFLATSTFPALRENALFLLDYLVRDPASGHLTTGPSCSPENAYVFTDGKSHNLCMGPTMDISIVRAVLSRLLQAGEVLGAQLAPTDHALLERARTALGELPPFKVGQDGRLQEWAVDYKDHEPGHRHISHLFGLFPEDQITPQGTPELARAAREVLDKRLASGGGSTGWSRSWIINCMARLQDGEACYRNILELFRQSTRPNLFDVCGLKENSPFQIDGNLGAPNGLIEMLLQSHGETPVTGFEGSAEKAKEQTVRMLPALPQAWPEGSFHGLCVRGGAEVDCHWEQGKAVSATFRARRDFSMQLIAPPSQSIASVTSNGKPVRAISQAERAHFDVQAGRVYTVLFS